jgi:hypothetical protein
VPGMRNVPAGVHRERGDACDPPVWWIIWLGAPHAEGSVIIGRSRRMARHLWHRFFPESGAACREVKGWVAGVEWLLAVYKEETGVEASRSG